MTRHEIVWSLDHPDLIVGLIEAEGVTIAPAPAPLQALIDAAVAELADPWPTPSLKAGVRDMLRHGGYRPSGRNKPASEYLIQTARKGRFPSINNVVDINNLMSMTHGWPMSALDRSRALGDAEAFEVRLGREGERYVFNSVGQEIDLRGLVGLGRAGAALVGNPVKDAMVAKTDDASDTLIVAIWTTRAVTTPEDVESAAASYAALLEAHTGASVTGVQVRTQG